MQRVYYAGKGGLGIILEEGDKERDFLENAVFQVNGEILTVGCMTTLSGLFSEPVEYRGVLQEQKNCMVFFIGMVNEVLFEKVRYYSCFYYIEENRVVNRYLRGTARDFIFKDGEWK